MSIAVDQLRRAVVARLVGVGELAEAPEVYETFRVPGKSPVHLEFVVGTPSHQWDQVHEGRQQPARGTLANTEVRVLFSYQLQPHDQRDSGDEASRLADTIRARLLERPTGGELAPAWPGELKIYWSGTTRTLGREATWLYLEVTFLCTHVVSLS